MKDFSWNFFWNSGQIDAYLLYKECHGIRDDEQDSQSNDQVNQIEYLQ